MNRRTLTLSLGTGLAALLVAAGVVTQVPYVALQPGPTFDTLGDKGTAGGKPVIEIEGATTYDPAGQLDLTTVSVTPSLTLGAALWGWFAGDQAVIPRELVYPPDKSEDDVERENQESMVASRDTATAAAFRELGIATERVTVATVPAGPSADVLQAGDVITTVDGKKVLDGTSLRQLIGNRSPGATVTIGWNRGSTARTATITTASSPSNPEDPTSAPRPVIGVETAVSPIDVDVDVTINLADVGGPSAGLMFALGIVDKLDRVDLTGGRHVAGTGEISAEGVVGPIGGIGQKLLGAKRAGATAFLVPADNCEEALRSPQDGLQMLKVGTLREALVGLRVLRDGGSPVSC